MQVLSKVRPQQTRARTASKLLREVECLARVQSCENVIPLRGIFEDSSNAYLVMDHCTGGDLEQLLEVRRSPLARLVATEVVRDILRYFQQVAMNRNHSCRSIFSRCVHVYCKADPRLGPPSTPTPRRPRCTSPAGSDTLSRRCAAGRGSD